MSKIKRILAIMLALVLVFQGSMSVLADATSTDQPSVTSITENNGARSAVQHDMENMITSVSIKIQVNGQWYYAGSNPEDGTPALGNTPVPADAPIEVIINYDPSAEIFAPGDSIVYKQLPQQLRPSSAQSGVVKDGSNEVGTYDITTSGRITIVFDNEAYLNANAGILKSGSISFAGNFVAGAWGENPGVSFGNIDIEIPLEAVTDLTINKYIISEENDYLEYQITVTADADNTKTATDVRVTDEFTSGEQYVGEIYDASASEFTTYNQEWNVGSLAPGQSATLTYKVKLDESYFADGSIESRSIYNVANVYEGSNWKDEARANHDASATLYIDKEGEYADGKATYTITVTAPSSNDWAVTDVEVEDVFRAGKDFVTDYTFPEGSSVDCDEDGKTFTWTIGTINPGESKELEYSVTVDEDIYMADTNLNNTATIKDSYIYDSESIPFEREWIEKTGSLQNDGRVKFTVDVDLDLPQLEGKTATVSDRITNEGWEYDGKITVYVDGSSDGEEFEPASSTSWTYEVEGGHTYRFVYYAKYVGTSLDQPVIYNTAKVEIEDKEYTDYETVYGNPTFAKEHVSLNGNIASWKSTITTDVPEGAVYTDWNEASYYDGTFTFTDEQIAAVKVGGAAEGKDFTVERVNARSFKVTFNEAITGVSGSNPITIEYESTLDIEDMATGETKYFYNYASLGDAQAEASCYYTKQDVISKEAGNYNPADQTITWYITVNKSGNLSGDATLTDVLPEGLEFVSAEIDVYGYYGLPTYLGEPVVDGQEVIIPIHNLQKSTDYRYTYITIEFVTKVVDKAFLSSNATKTYTNNVTVQCGDIEASASATKEISNSILSKTGKYDKTTAPDIEYTIIVNPAAQDLIEGSDTLKLIDTMGKGLMLKTTTLKIVDGAGNVITPAEAQLTIETNEKEETVFTLTLKDEKTYTITYNAYVPGEIGTEVTATNKAHFEGKPDSDTGEDNTITIEKSQATVIGAPYFYVTKMADGTFAKLEGAKFAIYAVNADGTIGNQIETLETNTLGEVLFNELEEDRVYAFKEIVAPDGYYVDDANAAFTFIAFSTSAITDAMRTKLGISESNVMQKGVAIERYNDETELTLDKVFGDKDIEDGTYYIGIFKDGTLVQNVAILVKDGTSTPVTVYGLTLGTYQIYETDKDGKRLSTASSSVVVVNGTTYEVSGEGTIVISQENPKVTAEIKNTKVVTLDPIKGTKILGNVNASGIKEFTFELFEADVNGNAIGEALDTATIEVKDGATAFVLAEDLFTFKESDAGKTFRYVVKEKVPADITAENPTKDGVTYDFAEYVITVTVNHSDEEGVTVAVKINGETVTAANGYYELPKQSEGSSFVNNYDVEGEITFEGKKTLENAEFDANDFKFVITGPHLTDADGKPVASLEFGHKEDGTLDYPTISYELADLEGAASKDFTYTIKEVHGGETIDGITYDDTVYTIVVTVTNTGKALEITSVKTTGLDFNNVYSAKGETAIEGTKELKGAALKADDFKFVITEKDGTYTATVSNDAEGNFEFVLPEFTHEDAGKTFTYEVSEVKGEALGFTYSEVVYVVTVAVTDNGDGTLTFDTKVNNSATEEILFTNEFEGAVTLTKFNDDKTEVLAGAEFTLYTEDGESLGIYVTDENGMLSVAGLTEGKYYFVETKAPAGYDVANSDPIPFEIKPGEQNDVYPVFEVINNQKAGTIILQKTTADGTALAGAAFDLYKQVGETADITVDEKIGSYVADENGQIVVPNLGWGTYYFVETAPAPGYVLDATPTESVIVDAAYVDEYNNVEFEGVVILKTNEATKVVINKVNPDGKQLAGAVLVIKDAVTGEVVKEFTTTDAPEAILAELEAGKTYILSELKAPEGYKMAEDVEFTVPAEDGIVEVTMIDNPIPAPIKTGDSSNILLYASVMMIALAAGAVTFFARRKRHN